MMRALTRFRWVVSLCWLGITTLFMSMGNASLFEPVRVLCEINGFRVPAIIDTGAEVTVMSTSCAKRCHLLNQIDTMHCGKAVGVGSGSSEIVGGIDKLGLRIGPLNFQSKVSVLRNSRCDLLIGLDVLKRFNCEVSLKTRKLRLYVRGEKVSVPFMKTEYEEYEEAQPTRFSLPTNPSVPPGHASQKYDRDNPSQQLDDDFYEDEEDSLTVDDMNVSMEGV